MLALLLWMKIMHYFAFALNILYLCLLKRNLCVRGDFRHSGMICYMLVGTKPRWVGQSNILLLDESY